jgi:hypothetical protein
MDKIRKQPDKMKHLSPDNVNSGLKSRFLSLNEEVNITSKSYLFRSTTDTINRYTIHIIRTDIPIATLLKSLTQPTRSGITAPPDIAIIIRPEISLLRSGYL